MDIDQGSSQREESELTQDPTVLTAKTGCFETFELLHPSIIIANILDKMLSANEGADLVKMIRDILNRLSQAEKTIHNLPGIEWDAKKQREIISKAREQLVERERTESDYGELVVLRKVCEGYYQRRIKEIMEFR
jgi:hypothetical protein